ncbi:hypothetical protein SORDD17_00361 [Streptococcus oralis]|uniref:Streptococcal pilin isopeptide linkage domain-containing protein n=1 Tax=Streptococcus oralis TaxID=1303 RepID=A0A139RNZ2_STROR|nr:FctA domain-containing protein [Streptococcus oralis]KXU16428.1 hypothetical protein SORDD17_00361 [Streptococcus oralis]
MSKPYDNSDNVTVELVDGKTNQTVETKEITGPTTFTLGQEILTNVAKSEVAYMKFTVTAEKDSANNKRTAIRATWGVDNKEAAAKNFDGPRSALQLFDVVNSANEGTTITDPQYYVPRRVSQKTNYLVVDKTASTYSADRTDADIQTYKKTGKEEVLGTFTIEGMEGQLFTASNAREFAGYKLYQTANANDKSGELRMPNVVGTRFFDVQTGTGGVKRIKEIVAEDGTTKVEIWTIKADKVSELATIKNDTSRQLDTSNFVKVYEVTLPPGKDNAAVNPDSLGQKIQINGYPEGSFYIVDTPGGALGNLHASNKAIVDGIVVATGSNIRLQNDLVKTPVVEYFYVKPEPVKVTPKVEKLLSGRTLVDGEFSFKLKEQGAVTTNAEEIVTNKNGKVTFGDLNFTKAGVYTYKITEIAGTDRDIDYDGMEITMTVTITEKNAVGDLQADVRYVATGGEVTDANDKIFNNYYVAPVTAQFDFSKALSGRTLKDGEFSFVLKDSNGTVLQTKKNDAQGKVSFDALSFTNTQVGTHKYTVEEVIPSEKEVGMTYDTMKAEVTVTVTKSGHTLTAVNTYFLRNRRNAHLHRS